MRNTGLSTPTPSFRPKSYNQEAANRWTKSMGKPSSQKLKANYNNRRTAYVRR